MKKQSYEPPMLSLYVYMVEKGYALSAMTDGYQNGPNNTPPSLGLGPDDYGDGDEGDPGSFYLL